MKILYDYYCFQEKYGGVSKYFVKILKEFPKDIQYKVAIKITKNEYIKELANVKLFNNISAISIRGIWRLFKMVNNAHSIKNALSGKYDIYHQSHYDPFLYKYIPSKTKSVMTLHDMNFFVIPEAYKNNPGTKKMSEWQKFSAAKADKIIAVSENTKKDVIDIWKIPEEKIVVSYRGADNINMNDCDLTRKIARPYILFVGRRSDYKNWAKYLSVFKIVSAHNDDLILVCTGDSFSIYERRLIEDMNLSNKVYQISADENEMVGLYKNAELFVYPSLYEGFGLPLLEAMNAACPIICSNTSCFPEVCAGAAVYFNPYSIKEMADVTLEVLNNRNLRQKLIEEGSKRKTMFSWKTCAQQHIDVYKSLV